MADEKCTFGELFVRTIDENGEEHFKPLTLSAEIDCDDDDFDLAEEEDADTLRTLLADKILYQHFLEGMVCAYEKMLGLDDGEDEE